MNIHTHPSPHPKGHIDRFSRFLGRPFVKRFALKGATVCKTVRPMLWNCCLSVLSCPACLPICNVGVLCQTVRWVKMKLVLDENPAPLPKKGAQPQFSAHVCCGQTAGWIKMPLGTKVCLGPNHIVLHGDPVPQKGHSPNFRPMSIVAKRSLLLSTCCRSHCRESYSLL